MNTNFESVLLKKLLYSGEYFNKTIPIIQQKHFTEVGNQKLFLMIKDHYKTYRTIPTITELASVLKNMPNEETRKTIALQLQAVHGTEEVQNMDFMLTETVNWVKDAMYYEALILGSDGMQEKNDEKKLKAKQLMEEMSKISIDADLGLAFDDIESRIEYYQRTDVGVLSQHASLNKRIGGGFLPGTLSLIASASGGGKSLLMTDLISGMIQDGKNVLLVSLEMSEFEIGKRVDANVLDLEINQLKSMNPDAIRNAYNTAKAKGIGQLYTKSYPPNAFSALMLEQLLDMYKAEQQLTFDMVFVDYAGIMKSDLVSHSVGLYSYVKSVVEELRATAIKRNIALCSASQLNRNGYGDDGGNDSISDSLGSVMTADFIMMLFQNEQMKEEGLITFKVTKNRFTGRTDKWDMNIDYKHMRFSDLLTEEATFSDLEIKDVISEVKANDAKVIAAHDKKVKQEEFDMFSELGL